MTEAVKNRLFTPGPTPVPYYAREAMAKPSVYHRTEEFKKLLISVKNRLSMLAASENQTVVLASSGTGAMEAAVTNFFSISDTVLVVRGGKFAERWGEICEAFHLTPVYYDIDYGKSADPQRIGEIMKDKLPKAVFIQATETSTGALNPIDKIGEVINDIDPSCLYVVDAISTMAAVPVKTDAWHIDLLVWGSQKALMIPPGLSFLTVSSKAIDCARKSNISCYYFSVIKEMEKQKTGSTLYTPATAQVAALDLTLEKIFDEGKDVLFDRHKKMAEAMRAALATMGFSIFPEHPSDALSVITKNGVDFEQIRSNLANRFGILMAGGQGILKGKIIRIAHMGYFDAVDMIGFLGAFEMVCSNYMSIKKSPVEKFIEVYSKK